MTEKTFKGKEISRKECNIEGATNTITINEFPFQKTKLHIEALQKLSSLFQDIASGNITSKGDTNIKSNK